MNPLPSFATRSLRAPAAALGLSLALGSFASATQITYDLFNHPDGSAAPPAYGLRLDGLVSHVDDAFATTFDFEYLGTSSMQLVYDDVSGDITISGTAQLNGTTDIYTIGFTYDGGSVTGTLASGLEADEDRSAPYENVGTISGPAGTFNLIDEAGNHTYSFRFAEDEHRLAGYPEANSGYAVGRGWVNHIKDLPGDPPNYDLDHHIYDSDWLFIAKRVPDGGTSALLLGVALGGLALIKRQSARK